jgi:hypothetical protein
MKHLWPDDAASFEDGHQTVGPSWASPKPLRPHPPIVRGQGVGPRTVEDLVEFGEGWMPLGRHEPGGATVSVRRALAAAGRSSDDYELPYFGDAADRCSIKHLATVGFSRVLFSVPPNTLGHVIDELDALARFVRETGR